MLNSINSKKNKKKTTPGIVETVLIKKSAYIP